MKIKTILSFLLAVVAFAACDNIDENERYTPTHYQPARAILIEDFTGQKCVNCPLATVTLSSLSQYFGDSIISVAIHGGPFGYAEPKGLATKEAETYYNALNIKEQPNGVINHRGYTTPYAQWTKEVCELIKTPSNTTLNASTSIEDNELTVNLTYSSYEANAQAILKVWLVEDSITAIQSLPAAWGGGNDKNYVHNHVYRRAINSVEGTSVSLSPTPVTEKFNVTLDNKYVIKNLSVIAFIYTESNGVLQVTKKHLKTHN